MFEPPAELDVIGQDADGHPRRPRWSWLSRAVAPLRDVADRRRGWLAAGGVGLAGAAGAGLVFSLSSPVAPQDRPPAPPAPPFTVTSTMAARVGSDGVFASGTAGGRPWRLAVQDIAGPGSACQAGVTVNGDDADLLVPASPGRTPGGEVTFVTPGASLPGAGFAYAQVPASANWVGLVSGGRQAPLRPVTVTRCGTTFRLIGFAYPLAAPLRLDSGGTVWTVPSSYSDPDQMLQVPELKGNWLNIDPATGEPYAEVSAGTTLGQSWSVTVAPGAAADCFGLITGAQQGTSIRTSCTPSGLDAIVAFALGSPKAGAQGYAYAVSAGAPTASIRLMLDGGRSQLIRPRAVAGSEYAAFVVAPPSRLVALDLLDSRGRVIGSASAAPPTGYLQFPP